MLGYRVYQARVQIGPRLYLGPPRLKQSQAEGADYAEIYHVIHGGNKDCGEDHYINYLRRKQHLFEPDQFERLKANAGVDAQQATAMMKKNVAPEPSPTPEETP